MFPGFGALFKTRTQQWNLSHTWTLGATAVNEFHFNYFREGQGNLNHPLNILASVHDSCGRIPGPVTVLSLIRPIRPRASPPTFPGRQGVPSILITGGFSIGNNNEGELPQAGNTFQWTDNFTKAFSKHTHEVRRRRPPPALQPVPLFRYQRLLYISQRLESLRSPNPDRQSSRIPT